MGLGEAYKRFHTFIENGALTSFSEFYGTRCIHDIQYVSKSVSQDGLVNIPIQTRDRKFDSSGKWRAEEETWEQFAQFKRFVGGERDKLNTKTRTPQTARPDA
jgi:hypothetical protein